MSKLDIHMNETKEREVHMSKVTEFPVIDMEATGRNIRNLREERSLTVREVQEFFGFEEPSAIYMWQRGRSLPTVDNLCALSKLFEVSMEEILVLRKPNDGDEIRSAAARRRQKCVNELFFLMAA